MPHQIFLRWLRTQAQDPTVFGAMLRLVVRGVGGVRGRARAGGAFLGYSNWAKQTAPKAAELVEDAASWIGQDVPKISIVIPIFRPDLDELSEVLESITKQSYPAWSAVLVDDGNRDPDLSALLMSLERQDVRFHVVTLEKNVGISRATNAGCEVADGHVLAFVDQDDVLAPDAMSRVMRAWQAVPHAVCAYTDEDKLDSRRRRCEPYLKPPFDRALLYARNYINHLTLVRRADFITVGGLDREMDGAQDYDLILRLLEQFGPKAFLHVPGVAYHWRKPVSGKNVSVTQADKAWEAGKSALLRHLARVGFVCGGVTRAFGGGWRLLPAQREAGSVAVVLPVRDRPDLLKACLVMLDELDWPGTIERVIVDNGSTDPDVRACLASLPDQRPGSKVISAPGPFNYSHLINLGVRSSRADLVLLLNNDVTGGDGRWLSEMALWARMPWVGCVGAALRYPSGHLQHGGIVLGPNGLAGHYERGAPARDAGAFGHLRLPRSCAAVTAACLLVRRSVFDAVDGFDETSFPVTFSDVDFGLRVRAAGFENVWTPYADLIHLEGASRGREVVSSNSKDTCSAGDALKARWGPWLDSDPCGNPFLNPFIETVSLRWPRSGNSQSGMF